MTRLLIKLLLQGLFVWNYSNVAADTESNHLRGANVRSLVQEFTCVDRVCKEGVHKYHFSYTFADGCVLQGYTKTSDLLLQYCDNSTIKLDISCTFDYVNGLSTNSSYGPNADDNHAPVANYTIKTLLDNCECAQYCEHGTVDTSTPDSPESGPGSEQPKEIPVADTIMKVPPLMVGSDVDKHGCKASAGYSYCKYTDTCIRPWETNCTSETSMPVQNVLVGNDTDAHGCKASAGYSYCKYTDTCIRPWETNCTSETSMPVQNVLVGNDTDAHGCKASAGYSYCKYTDTCIRPWETNCTSSSISVQSTVTTSTFSQNQSSFSSSGSIDFHLTATMSSSILFEELLTFSLMTLDGKLVATKTCTCQHVTFSGIQPGKYTVVYNVPSDHSSTETVVAENKYESEIVTVTSGHSTTVASEIKPSISNTTEIKENSISKFPKEVPEKGPMIEALTKSPTASPSPHNKVAKETDSPIFIKTKSPTASPSPVKFFKETGSPVFAKTNPPLNDDLNILVPTFSSVHESFSLPTPSPVKQSPPPSPVKDEATESIPISSSPLVVSVTKPAVIPTSGLTGTLEGFFFADRNQNKGFDEGEVPISNAVMTVINGEGTLATQPVSNSDGRAVASLSAGSYTVTVSVVGYQQMTFTVIIIAGETTKLEIPLSPIKNTPSPVKQSLPPSPVKDEAGQTVPFSSSPPATTSNPTVIPTSALTGTLEGFFFVDKNQNKGFDEGEVPVSNAAMIVINSSGALAAQPESNENGLAVATDLSAGSYTVTVSVVGYQQITFTVILIAGETTKLEIPLSPIKNTPSPVKQSLPQSPVKDEAGQSVPIQSSPVATSNPAVIPTSSLTGTLEGFFFVDKNQNKGFDEGEVPVSNAAMNVISSEGAFAAKPESNSDGLAVATNLSAGSYTVTVSVVGYQQMTFTVIIIAGETTKLEIPLSPIKNTPSPVKQSLPPSPVKNEAGQTVPFSSSPPATTSNPTVIPTSDLTGTLEGFFFVDKNKNKRFDEGEVPVSNAAMNVISSEGAFAAKPESNGDGLAVATNLSAGSYTVTVSVVGYQQMTFTVIIIAGETTKLEIPLSPIKNTPSPVKQSLPPSPVKNEAGQTVPFSSSPPVLASGGIRGTVFKDTNGNGLKDVSEQTLPNIPVKATSSASGTVYEATTNGNGLWEMDGLPEGTYSLEYKFDAKYLPSAPNGGKVPEVFVTNGQITTVDFYLQFGVIAGTIYADENSNGLQEQNESGIRKVEVSIFATNDLNTPVSVTQTDSNGMYSFSDLLLSQQYQVVISATNYASAESMIFTGDLVDKSTGSAGPFSFTATIHVVTVNIGIVVITNNVEAQPAPSPTGNVSGPSTPLPGAIEGTVDESSPSTPLPGAIEGTVTSIGGP